MVEGGVGKAQSIVAPTAQEAHAQAGMSRLGLRCVVQRKIVVAFLPDDDVAALAEAGFEVSVHDFLNIVFDLGSRLARSTAAAFPVVARQTELEKGIERKSPLRAGSGAWSNRSRSISARSTLQPGAFDSGSLNSH